jgi:hypothetical protein
MFRRDWFTATLAGVAALFGVRASAKPTCGVDMAGGHDWTVVTGYDAATGEMTVEKLYPADLVGGSRATITLDANGRRVWAITHDYRKEA